MLTEKNCTELVEERRADYLAEERYERAKAIGEEVLAHLICGGVLSGTQDSVHRCSTVESIVYAMTDTKLGKNIFSDMLSVVGYAALKGDEKAMRLVENIGGIVTHYKFDELG